MIDPDNLIMNLDQAILGQISKSEVHNYQLTV